MVIDVARARNSQGLETCEKQRFIEKKRYLVAFGILLVMMLGYTDRINFSIAAPAIIADFGLTRGQFGLLTSLFSWSYLLCLIPIGVLIDRFGVKLILALGIAVWSIGAGMTGLSTAVWILVLARVTLGVGEAPLLLGTNLVSRAWSPITERGFFSGINTSGGIIGPAVGSVLSAYLIALYGWQMSFFIFGGVGIVFAIAWYFGYNRVEDASFISDAERRYIVDHREPADGRAVDAKEQALTIDGLLRTQSIWGLMLANGCSVYINYLFLSFLPLYLSDTKGIKELGAGWVTGMTYGSGAIGSLLIVALSDKWLRAGSTETRLRKRRTSLIAAQLLCTPLIVLPWITSITGIVVVVAWVLTFVFATAALGVTLAGELTVGSKSVGRMFSLLTVGGNSFGLASPIITGYLIDSTHNYTAPFIVATALAPVGAMATFTLSRREMRPD